jgi:hypothetical protein
LLSVTRTVTAKLPAWVGVPLKAPLLLNTMPAGSAPDTRAKLYGAVPPVAESVVLYALPTVAAGTLVWSMDGPADVLSV